MADTARTRTALAALLADNVTGQISAQDLRDFLVTVMPVEFEAVADYWKEPMPSQLTGDKTFRGWVDHSQVMKSACSFGDALYMWSDGTWGNATGSRNAAASCRPCTGLALESYAAADSQCSILRRGLIMMEAKSALMSGHLHRAVYLQSDASALWSITCPTGAGYSHVIGMVEPNGIGSSNTWTMRFDGTWGVLRS